MKYVWLLLRRNDGRILGVYGDEDSVNRAWIEDDELDAHNAFREKAIVNERVDVDGMTDVD